MASETQYLKKKKVKIIVKVMRDNAPFTLKMLAEIKVLGSLQNSYGKKFLILKSMVIVMVLNTKHHSYYRKCN